MKQRLWPTLASLLGFVGLSACQTQTVEETAQPAVLVSGDAQSMVAITSTLSEAVGRATIELGPTDLTKASTVTVLPPPLGPLETRSLATPTAFDLMMTGESCVLVERETGVRHALEGVACRVADPEELAWHKAVAGAQAHYTTTPRAVMKVNDAIYVQPGETGALIGDPADPSSYQWTLEPGAETPVLSVRFELDDTDTPRLTLIRDGVETQLSTDGGDLTAEPINDNIAITGRPSGLDTDDPRFGLLVYNQQHEDAANFKGLSHFEYAAEFRVEADFVRTDPPTKKTMQTERGLVKNFYEVGRAKLAIGETPIEMPLYTGVSDLEAPEYVFGLFTDATTGRETYSVGRYLDVELGERFPPKTVIVDFNYAYNPLCARSRHFNCPLVDFDIPTAIRAGERYQYEADK